MHASCATLLALAPLLSTAFQGAPAAPKPLLGLSTGNTKHPAGELVELDPADGKTTIVSALVSPGGQRHGTDLLALAGKAGVLVTVVEIGDNKARTFVTRFELASGKALKEWAPIDGSMDALCRDAQGVVRAIQGASRPCKLVTLDLEKEEVRELGTLDKRLWPISLAFDARGELWGLHMRTPELDHDALVRLDPATGALRELVRLDLPTQALALEIDARGRFLVTADKETLHVVEAKTGKSKSSVATGALRLVGLDPAR